MKIRHIKRSLFGFVGCANTLKAAPYRRQGCVWPHAWAVGPVGPGKWFLATGARGGLVKAFAAADAAYPGKWICLTKPGQHPTWGETFVPTARG